MAIELTDDGTLDTVLRCSDCGEEMRYNYEPDDTHCPVCDADEHAGCYCALDKPAWENALMRHYDAFVEWAIEDATEQHDCALAFDEGAEGEHAARELGELDDPDAEPTEPQEDDITTTDHETFYQSGKVVLRAIDGPTGEYWEYRDYSHADANGVRSGARYLPLGRFATSEQAIKAYMVKTQFWPNVWFISDHGNAHRIDLTEQE